MSNASTARNTLGTIDSFLAQVRSKTAEAHTEAGGFDGPTTHPVKNVTDNTETATTGARAKENEADVKEDQGKPSVDSTPEANAKSAEVAGAGTSGTAESDQYNIGLRVTPTGEDVPPYKAGKQDGGYKGPSTHPARTDNNELDGFKYAGDVNTDSLEKIGAAIGTLGNEICAALIADWDTEKDASLKGLEGLASRAGGAIKNEAGKLMGEAKNEFHKHPNIGKGVIGGAAVGAGAAGAYAATHHKKSDVDPRLAEAYGWDIAGIMSGTMDKDAADVMVQQTIGQLVKTGIDAGDMVADYLTAFYTEKQAQAKRADDGPPPGAGGPPPGAGGPPPGAGGPPPGAGGDPMAAALGGGGAPPGGDPTGGAGGGGIAELEQLLQQLGITPEELSQALMQVAQGGGAAGGGAPDAGAGGAGDPAAAQAAAASGPGGGAAGPQPGAPGLNVSASDHGGKEVQAAAVQMIREIVTRSRAKTASKR